MMSFRFRDHGNLVGKPHRLHKILEFELLGDFFGTLLDSPSTHVFRHRLRFHWRHRLCPAFACNALFLCQVHAATLSRDTIVPMKMLFFRFRAIFEVILDTILPLRARSARTKSRTAEEIALSPTVHELLGTPITTLTYYSNTA